MRLVQNPHRRGLPSTEHRSRHQFCPQPQTFRISCYRRPFRRSPSKARLAEIDFPLPLPAHAGLMFQERPQNLPNPS
jgi:hypothetical protein